MAANPDNLQYTKDHEWIHVEGETGTIGITALRPEAAGGHRPRAAAAGRVDL
jgi:glycine cleavage system H protein